MELPKDEAMLLSFINMKLRDENKDLDELCDDLNVDKEEIIRKLSKIDYEYDSENRQFV